MRKRRQRRQAVHSVSEREGCSDQPTRQCRLRLPPVRPREARRHEEARTHDETHQRVEVGSDSHPGASCDAGDWMHRERETGRDGEVCETASRTSPCHPLSQVLVHPLTNIKGLVPAHGQSNSSRTQAGKPIAQEATCMSTPTD